MATGTPASPPPPPPPGQSATGAVVAFTAGVIVGAAYFGDEEYELWRWREYQLTVEAILQERDRVGEAIAEPEVLLSGRPYLITNVFVRCVAFIRRCASSLACRRETHSLCRSTDGINQSYLQEPSSEKPNCVG